MTASHPGPSAAADFLRDLAEPGNDPDFGMARHVLAGHPPQAQLRPPPAAAATDPPAIFLSFPDHSIASLPRRQPGTYPATLAAYITAKAQHPLSQEQDVDCPNLHHLTATMAGHFTALCDFKDSYSGPKLDEFLRQCRKAGKVERRRLSQNQTPGNRAPIAITFPDDTAVTVVTNDGNNSRYLLAGGYPVDPKDWAYRELHRWQGGASPMEEWLKLFLYKTPHQTEPSPCQQPQAVQSL